VENTDEKCGKYRYKTVETSKAHKKTGLGRGGRGESEKNPSPVIS